MEDVSPDFGCYGVKAVTTPAFDALASQGVRFGRAFSTAGVCAPSRSAIISGVYQMAIGTQHMRSNMPKPAGRPTLPSTLGEERATNPFLRCAEPVVVESANKYLGTRIGDPVSVFAAIREWKNRF